jgi:hypothetical protein
MDSCKLVLFCLPFKESQWTNQKFPFFCFVFKIGDHPKSPGAGQSAFLYGPLQELGNFF